MSLALRTFKTPQDRACAVRWVNMLVQEGMERVIALKLVGLTASQYYRWKKEGQ